MSNNVSIEGSVPQEWTLAGDVENSAVSLYYGCHANDRTYTKFCTMVALKLFIPDA